MKKTTLLAAAVLLAFSGTLRAAAFRPSDVPASAYWILHLDVSGLKGTIAGRTLLANPKVTESAPLAEFTSRFGLDPRKDVRGVTVYTVSTGRLDAVAVIDPDPAAAARFKSWREGVGFTAQAYGAHTIYTRAAGQGAPLHAMTPDGRMVSALTLDLVRQGLDVLDGKRAPLAAPALPALADRKGGAGAILLLAGRAFGPEMQGLLPQISLLKKANSLCLAVGDKEGQVTAGLSVCADDEPEAVRVQNALLGFIEIGRAMAVHNGRPDPAKALAVTRETTTVRADGIWKLEDVLTLIRGPQAP